MGLGYHQKYPVRHQGGIGLPSEVPSHMYAFPKKYDGQEMLLKLSKRDILDIAQLAAIGDSPIQKEFTTKT